MQALPTGTVSFLFTDIEGSTELLLRVGDTAYRDILEEHHRLMRDAFDGVGGVEIDTQGDAFFVAFQEAAGAVAGAVQAQRNISGHGWPEGVAIRVRMGLHSGEPTLGPGGYVGIDVHRAARICSAGHGGQILLSEHTVTMAHGALPPGVELRDMGEHRLKDLARPEHLFQVIIPGHPDQFPALKSLDLQTTNLPSLQLTSFIGREREMAEIRRLLGGARLVTLVGAGGAGKTRLALQVAADMLEEFPKGVWLAELAPLTDPALVPQTVASVFGVREAPGRPITELLVEYLRTRALLLVLDNCEHLVEPAARLAGALLRGCPGVRILATSREALGVAGESAYRVPPMSRPDPRGRVSVEELMETEAAQLFLERAALSNPQFLVTDANAPAIAQIVHRLDGIPLAIELAAARVKVLSAEQIAKRLDDRFRLLTGGSRTGLPHHQTLQAAVAWSYDLLSPQERALFDRLSVFAGGFSLEAVEAVCADDPADVLDLLTRLVDKSLVATESIDHDIRYRMLDTIRHYSLERLGESGEGDAVRSRHLEWHAGLAAQAEPALVGADQLGWLDRLELEHDNLRSGLEWARARDSRLEAGLRMAGALHRFWILRGYLREGRDWLEGLLARAQGASEATRAKAAYGASVLAFHQGDMSRAEAWGTESLQLSRALEDPLGIALALNALGIVARNRGDYERAALLLDESIALSRRFACDWPLAEALNVVGVAARRQGDYARATALFEESLALWRRLGDRWGLAASLAHLGVVARYLGDYERASALHEESLDLRRALGDRRNVAAALSSLGVVAWHLGDYAGAAALFEEGLGLSRELGDRQNVAATLCSLGFVEYRLGRDARATELLRECLALSADLGDKVNTAAALCNLGFVATHQGDLVQAAAFQSESLSLYRTLGDWAGIADCLLGLAGIALAQRRADRATRLLAAAETLRESKRLPLPPSDRADHDRAISTARALLGEELFRAVWAEGRSMGPDEAIATATV
jgi:predicted ATPase/class 3 adenylate cyclase